MFSPGSAGGVLHCGVCSACPDSRCRHSLLWQRHPLPEAPSGGGTGQGCAGHSASFGSLGQPEQPSASLSKSHLLLPNAGQGNLNWEVVVPPF